MILVPVQVDMLCLPSTWIDETTVQFIFLLLIASQSIAFEHFPEPLNVPILGTLCAPGISYWTHSVFWLFQHIESLSWSNGAERTCSLLPPPCKRWHGLVLPFTLSRFRRRSWTTSTGKSLSLCSKWISSIWKGRRTRSSFVSVRPFDFSPFPNCHFLKCA